MAAHHFSASFEPEPGGPDTLMRCAKWLGDSRKNSRGREQTGPVASLLQLPVIWASGTAAKAPTSNQIEAMLFEEGRNDLNGVLT